MEQKEGKKRWRPSLTAYRALEDEVSVLREQLRIARSETTVTPEGDEFIEGIHTLVMDSDAWREKYVALFKDWKDVSQRLAFAEEDVKKLRKRVSDAEADLRDASDEVSRLRSQGLLARIFNR